MKNEIRFINLFQKILSFNLLIFAFGFVALNIKEYLIYHRLLFQKSQYLQYYIIFLFGLFLLSVFRHVLLLVVANKIGREVK